MVSITIMSSIALNYPMWFVNLAFFLCIIPMQFIKFACTIYHSNMTVATYMPGLFWIGASDMAVEGEFLWLPGTAELDYSNWAPTEPDNYNNQDHCVAIDLHRNYQWADDICQEQRNFICEIDAT